MSNISSLKINNQSYNLKDPTAIGIGTPKSKKALNNMLSFDNDDLYTLTTDQIRKLNYGENVDEVLPIGTYIHLPQVQVTDTQGIGSGSITYTEGEKQWVFAGAYQSFLIFVLDDEPYKTEDSSEGIYPYNLTAIREIANTSPTATAFSQYGYNTAKEFYKHMMSQLEKVIKAQFNAFFVNKPADYSLEFMSLKNAITEKAATSRYVYTGNAAIQTILQGMGYYSDNTDASFSYSYYDFAFLNSHNVFGYPALPQHMGKVVQKNSVSKPISQEELDVYTTGGNDYKFQFPYYKYCDDQPLENKFMYGNFYFDEKRLTAKFVTGSNFKVTEAFPVMNGSKVELDPYDSGETQSGYFRPYVAIRIGD